MRSLVCILTDMSTSARVGLIVILIVAIMAAVAVVHNNNTARTTELEHNATTTPQTVFDKFVTDSAFTFAFPGSHWALATSTAQFRAASYIPACSEDYTYCLYYTGKDFVGTNFESAGLRVGLRSDLRTERTCQQTPPEGFTASPASGGASSTPTSTRSGDEYATSLFANIGDAGAGHIAAGSLYRLFVRATTTCYEFETRIGHTQFANYPEGSIEEFTLADNALLDSELQAIVNTTTLSTGTKNLF